MEFRDLKAQYRNNKEAIDAAIARVISATNFIAGNEVEELENELAEYVGVKHCISCANGTDALQLALMAWSIGAGDAVFVPDFTFFSTAEVVALLGATPIFVDVEFETFNISSECLEKAIQRVIQEGVAVPKAIIAVDLFGLPANYGKIKQIANKYQLHLLEDGAQGFGGRIETQKACSFGDISTTSFFPAKPLGCYGDGGAIFTNNDEWTYLIKSYCTHGKGKDKYDNVRVGMNSRLDTLQAAILIEKLKIFRSFELCKCNDIAKRYTGLLGDYVQTPLVPPTMYSSWAQYTIKFNDEHEREYAVSQLKENSIPCNVYYMKAMHEQQAFANVSFESADLQVASLLCKTALSLPIHAYLEERDIDKVCKIISAVKSSGVMSSEK